MFTFYLIPIKLFKLLRKQLPNEAEILNSGLNMAMEFGQNWLQSIGDRLLNKYSFLTAKQIAAYDTICSDIMREANKFVCDKLLILSNTSQKIKRQELKSQLEQFVLDKYNWINSDNISKLFSQSCYYAYKEGLITPLV